MLTIKAIKQDVDYHAYLVDDYYLEGGELGLRGVVGRRDHDRLGQEAMARVESGDKQREGEGELQRRRPSSMCWILARKGADH